MATKRDVLQLLFMGNISVSFGIDDFKRHANDQDSVMAWINEWKGSSQNPTLFYKMQGMNKRVEVEHCILLFRIIVKLFIL